MPLAAVETPLICEFVRERIRGSRTTLPLQQHASVASGFTEIEYVSRFRCSCWLLEGLVEAGTTGGHFPKPVYGEPQDCRHIRPISNRWLRTKFQRYALRN